MEKNILIYLDSIPQEYLIAKDTTTIESIKKHLQKYNNVKIQMFINPKTELKVFNNDNYEIYSLYSICNRSSFHFL